MLCAPCACRLLCLFGAGGEHLHTLGADSGTAQLQQLSWLGDNEVLACSGEEVTVWHVSQEQYKELRTYAATNKAPIRHIATSPNGRFIAAACDNGVVSEGAAGRARGGGGGAAWAQGTLASIGSQHGVGWAPLPASL